RRMSLLQPLEPPTVLIHDRSGEAAPKLKGFALTTKADPSTRAEAAVRITSSFRIYLSPSAGNFVMKTHVGRFSVQASCPASTQRERKKPRPGRTGASFSWQPNPHKENRTNDGRPAVA